MTLGLAIVPSSPAGQYFVSTTGSDTNPGTFDQPFLSIAWAVSQPDSVFKPGDTVTVRGGVYPLGATISITKNGTGTARYCLLAYPGERPVLDFSSMPVASTNRGINFKGSYWYVRGFDIKGAGDNGMNLSGSHNIVEFCAFYENRDTGLQLGGGASDNQIINCDAYYNADPGQGNADGFSPKLDVGSGNSFYGCRSWQNSDDGWDGYLRGANDVTTLLENCWVFDNGYLKDGTASAGNGNGFKLGGSDTKDLMHNFVLKRCVAFDNRVKGFDQNSNRGSMTLYHCTGYRNATNYALADTLAASQGKLLTIKNSLALGFYGSIRSNAIQQTNSWLGFVVTDADFQSVDTAGVRAPRKPDGSLPDVGFLNLALGSPLIDAGTELGMPFNGTAPDLGAFEAPAEPTATPEFELIAPDFRLMPCFPNPFNPSTRITYVIPEAGDVTLRIFDVSGKLVREIVGGRQEGGVHLVTWNGEDGKGVHVASGVYFARLEFRGAVRTSRLVLAR
jgi:Pel9A-like, right handed beta helix region/FlgD Ig-like domain